VIHDAMPYDPIQGQSEGYIGPKVAKMAIANTLCSEKNTHSHFLLYLDE